MNSKGVGLKLAMVDLKNGLHRVPKLYKPYYGC